MSHTTNRSRGSLVCHVLCRLIPYCCSNSTNSLSTSSVTTKSPFSTLHVTTPGHASTSSRAPDSRRPTRSAEKRSPYPCCCLEMTYAAHKEVTILGENQPDHILINRWKHFFQLNNCLIHSNSSTHFSFIKEARYGEGAEESRCSIAQRQ